MKYRTRAVEPVPDLQILELHGELDLATVPLLDEWLATAPQADFIVDLANVPFADSTGVGFLIRLWNRGLEAGRRVVLCGLTPGMQRTVRVVGLTSWLTVVETLDEAVLRCQSDSVA